MRRTEGAGFGGESGAKLVVDHAKERLIFQDVGER